MLTKKREDYKLASFFKGHTDAICLENGNWKDLKNVIL